MKSWPFVFVAAFILAVALYSTDVGAENLTSDTYGSNLGSFTIPRWYGFALNVSRDGVFLRNVTLFSGSYCKIYDFTTNSTPFPEPIQILEAVSNVCQFNLSLNKDYVYRLIGGTNGSYSGTYSGEYASIATPFVKSNYNLSTSGAVTLEGSWTTGVSSVYNLMTIQTSWDAAGGGGPGNFTQTIRVNDTARERVSGQGYIMDICGTLNSTGLTTCVSDGNLTYNLVGGDSYSVDVNFSNAYYDIDPVNFVLTQSGTTTIDTRSVLSLDTDVVFVSRQYAEINDSELELNYAQVGGSRMEYGVVYQPDFIQNLSSYIGYNCGVNFELPELRVENASSNATLFAMNGTFWDPFYAIAAGHVLRFFFDFSDTPVTLYPDQNYSIYMKFAKSNGIDCYVDQFQTINQSRDIGFGMIHRQYGPVAGNGNYAYASLFTNMSIDTPSQFAWNGSAQYMELVIDSNRRCASALSGATGCSNRSYEFTLPTYGTNRTTRRGTKIDLGLLNVGMYQNFSILYNETVNGTVRYVALNGSFNLSKLAEVQGIQPSGGKFFTASSMLINWTAASGGAGTTTYDVTLEADSINTSVSNTTSTTTSQAISGTIYSGRVLVRARDEILPVGYASGGNFSTKLPPYVNTVVVDSGGSPGGPYWNKTTSSLNVTWTDNAIDSVALVKAGSTLLATVYNASTTTVTVNDFSAGQSQVTVELNESFGTVESATNTSDAFNVSKLSRPTNVQPSGIGVGSPFNVTWSASMGGVGTTEYDVYVSFNASQGNATIATDTTNTYAQVNNVNDTASGVAWVVAADDFFTEDPVRNAVDFTISINSADIAGAVCALTYPNELDLPAMAKVPVNFTVSSGGGFDGAEAVSLLLTLNSYASNTFSCGTVVTNSTHHAYYCNVSMPFYYGAGQYALTINATAKTGISDSFTQSGYCEYGQLLASQRDIDVVVFPSASPGVANSTSTSPLVVRNTGNVPMNVSMRAYNLAGRQQPAFPLAASTFRVGASLPSSAVMAHNVTTGLNVNISNGALTNSSLWFWLSMPSGQVSQQYYSAIPWQVVVSG